MKYLGVEKEEKPKFRKPKTIFEYAEWNGELWVSHILDLNWVDEDGNRQYVHYWKKASAFDRHEARKAGLWTPKEPDIWSWQPDLMIFVGTFVLVLLLELIFS